MTSLKGDLRSIMGTPFGGVGHAVLIFSRVTRAAFNSDSVVLQLHDRIEMPEEADGKFQVDGLDPGPIRIELEGGTVHNHGWNIDLPDEGVWSLTDLVDAQVDWSPAVIGRAEAAAREAREHADRAEAGADRVGTAEQVGVWAGEASASASAADSARSGAVTARNAAQSARDAAEGHANRAATSESNAKTSETNAKQSETNAGDYAAVATTAATEAVDAMESASGAAASIANSVSAAAGHADRAEQYESGAAAYAQNASDAADRVGTADQIEGWVQQAKDAADRIGTAEQVEGWVDDARNSASSASSSESKAKEYRDSAATAATSAVDNVRTELGSIVSDAADYATESSRSAARAKTSETNASTHEANSLSAAERAEFAAEETIQQVEGDFATRNYADSKAWVKRALADGEDLNEVTAPGMYTVRDYTQALSLVNRPTVPNAIDRASVEVLDSGSGAVQQTWYPMGVASRTDMPVMRRRRDNGGTWTEWERINAFTPAKETYIMQSISAAKWEKRSLVRDEDLDSIIDPGVYYVPTYTVANSLVNRPALSTAINPATIEVLATGRGQIRQVWTTLSAADRPAPVMSRRRDNANVWTEWEETGAKTDAPEYDPLEAVGMTATGASGELTGIRSLLRGLTPGTAPVWSWWAPAPTEELTMPTHDGAGQTCHPSVLYFPNGWNGWKYWMAHTPYPNFQEAHEDPNIAVSNDGTTWQVPDGLTNPLDDGLGRPNYHNSDAHLVMNGNTMVITWRTVDRPNGGQNIIYARTSADGVNWTAKTEVLKVPLGSSESTFVAQSLVKMPTGWRLYGIRSMYNPNRLGYYETSVNTIPKTSDWGAAQNCDVGEIPTGRDPWHSEVQRLSATDWVAVISDGRYGSTGVDGDIYLATSTDGVKWDVSPLPLTPRANGVINSLYKTGFVVSGTGSDRTFDLWVSGYRTDKRTWGIYRTLAEYRGSKQAETLPVTRVGVGTPEGKVAAPVGSIYTDSEATNGAIRWIKTSGTGTTGWRVEYGDTGWRDISSSIVNRSSPAVFADGAGIQIRRFQGTVQYRLFGGVTVTSQFGKLTDNFTGFRPKWDGQMELISRAADLKAGTWQVRLENGISGEKLCLAGESRLMMWGTEQPWPSTLPGTPV